MLRGLALIDLSQKHGLRIGYIKISDSGAEPAEERIPNIRDVPSIQAGKVKKLSERELSAKWTP